LAELKPRMKLDDFTKILIYKASFRA